MVLPLDHTSLAACLLPSAAADRRPGIASVGSRASEAPNFQTSVPTPFLVQTAAPEDPAGKPAVCHNAAFRGSSDTRAAKQRKQPSGRGRTCDDVRGSAVFEKRHTRMPGLAVALAMRAVTGCKVAQSDIGEGRPDPARQEGRPTSTISTCCSRSYLSWVRNPTLAARVLEGMHLAARPRLEAGAAEADCMAHPSDGCSVPGPAPVAVVTAAAVSWVAAYREPWRAPT